MSYPRVQQEEIGHTLMIRHITLDILYADSIAKTYKNMFGQSLLSSFCHFWFNLLWFLCYHLWLFAHTTTDVILTLGSCLLHDVEIFPLSESKNVQVYPNEDQIER